MAVPEMIHSAEVGAQLLTWAGDICGLVDGFMSASLHLHHVSTSSPMHPGICCRPLNTSKYRRFTQLNRCTSSTAALVAKRVTSWLRSAAFGYRAEEMAARTWE